MLFDYNTVFGLCLLAFALGASAGWGLRTRKAREDAIWADRAKFLNAFLRKRMSRPYSPQRDQ